MRRQSDSVPLKTVMKKKILVVDDSASVRESLKRILEDASYAVTLASNGLEGEQLLASQNFDLLILDLNMPDRDGWDVLGDVNAAYPLLPVVIVTGMFDQLDSTVFPGAAALLKKPIDVPPLLSAIETALTETFEQRLGRATAKSQVEPWQRIAQ